MKSLEEIQAELKQAATSDGASEIIKLICEISKKELDIEDLRSQISRDNDKYSKYQNNSSTVTLQIARSYGGYDQESMQNATNAYNQTLNQLGAKIQAQEEQRDKAIEEFGELTKKIHNMKFPLSEQDRRLLQNLGQNFSEFFRAQELLGVIHIALFLDAVHRTDNISIDKDGGISLNKECIIEMIKYIRNLTVTASASNFDRDLERLIGKYLAVVFGVSHDNFVIWSLVTPDLVKEVKAAVVHKIEIPGIIDNIIDIILQGLNQIFPSIKDEFTKRLEENRDGLMSKTQSHLEKLQSKAEAFDLKGGNPKNNPYRQVLSSEDVLGMLSRR